MNADDDDKLWDLLGRAKQPAVSPFFSRNVLRAVREEEGAPNPRAVRSFSLQSWRRWTWRAAWAGACVVAALVTVTPGGLLRSGPESALHSGISKQIVGNPDYEVIKHLDELVADEESSVWLDDSVN